MKYLKQFEVATDAKYLLCVKGDVSSMESFKYGKKYKIEKYGVAYVTVYDDWNNQRNIYKTSQLSDIATMDELKNYEYFYSANSIFTTDKSIEDYEKRKVQARFDL